MGSRIQCSKINLPTLFREMWSVESIRSYIGNVAKAVAGREGFQDSDREIDPSEYWYSILIVTVYLFATLAFAVGAAVLSYRYNVAQGTGSVLTVMYVISAFIFSYFYYPYHALILSGNGLKQRGGAKR